MIIRLSLRRTILPLAIGLLIALPALVVLGRSFTPIPPRVFSWTTVAAGLAGIMMA